MYGRDLPKSLMDENGFNEDDRIIMETLNDDLRMEFKKMPEGGMRDYLLQHGDFEEVDINE